MRIDRRVTTPGSGLAIAFLAVAAGCTAPAPVAQRANPASVHCVQQGGKLLIERGPGGEYGACLFDDKRQCEECAPRRGACPAGGLRVTGYLTAVARYCAISGARYRVSARGGPADEAGCCTRPAGRSCSAERDCPGQGDAAAPSARW